MSLLQKRILQILEDNSSDLDYNPNVASFIGGYNSDGILPNISKIQKLARNPVFDYGYVGRPNMQKYAFNPLLGTQVSHGGYMCGGASDEGNKINSMMEHQNDGIMYENNEPQMQSYIDNGAVSKQSIKRVSGNIINGYIEPWSHSKIEALGNVNVGGYKNIGYKNEGGYILNQKQNMNISENVGGNWTNMFKKFGNVISWIFNKKDSKKDSNYKQDKKEDKKEYKKEYKQEKEVKTECKRLLERENIYNKKDYKRWALKNHPDKKRTPEDIERANELFANVMGCIQSEGLGGAIMDESYGGKKKNINSKMNEGLKQYQKAYKMLREKGLSPKEARDKIKESKQMNGGKWYDDLWTGIKIPFEMVAKLAPLAPFIL